MLLSRVLVQIRSRRVAAEIGPYVDRQYYRARYPDVAASGIDPALHFVMHGASEGRDPNPHFRTKDYCQRYPELISAKINPLVHFLRHGGTIPTPPGNSTGLDDATEAMVRENFDSVFYRHRAGNMLGPEDDPVVHYLSVGYAEGLDPSPEFETRYYLLNNPDVAESGLNPFVHFLLAGKSEGRSGKFPGGWRGLRLRNQRPIEETARNWLRRDELPTPNETRAAAARLTQALQDADRDVLISIGHDDYRNVSGGIQLCIGHEQAIAAERGVLYLNLNPWQPLPVLAEAERSEAQFLRLVLDGEDLGVTSHQEVIAALGSTGVGNPARFAITIHSLLGHSPENILELARAAGLSSCALWLHDYTSLCAGYNLMRNDVAFCGAPDIRSAACGVCRYGRVREEHLKRIEALFEALDVHVLAPADVPLSLWRDRTTFQPKTASVLPLLTLSDLSTECPVPRRDDTTVCIGYLGAPYAHKGWPMFERIAQLYRGDPAFQFHYFGDHDVDSRFHRTLVQVRPGEKNQMVAAVAGAGIDLVFHWAEWPETFSFSTYEALAAGAFVVTNASSGNVAAIVRKTGRGIVLENASDLDAAFVDGTITRLARQARDAAPVGIEMSQISFESSHLFPASKRWAAAQ